jgi:hypothetical protein
VVVPRGAYFTDLPENEPMLAKKLRIPRDKLHYVFAFVDGGDLPVASPATEVGTSSILGQTTSWAASGSFGVV